MEEPMPRKPNEGQPLHEKGKMTDEARKAIYGSSEEETAPEDKEHGQRQYSGPSPSGSPDTGGSDQHN
jgi:hypothetical protein